MKDIEKTNFKPLKKENVFPRIIEEIDAFRDFLFSKENITYPGKVQEIKDIFINQHTKIRPLPSIHRDSVTEHKFKQGLSKLIEFISFNLSKHYSDDLDVMAKLNDIKNNWLNKFSEKFSSKSQVKQESVVEEEQKINEIAPSPNVNIQEPFQQGLLSRISGYIKSIFCKKRNIENNTRQDSGKIINFKTSGFDFKNKTNEINEHVRQYRKNAADGDIRKAFLSEKGPFDDHLDYKLTRSVTAILSPNNKYVTLIEEGTNKVLAKTRV
jgi:hypothetical protein